MSLADIASDFGAALGVPEPSAQTTYHVAVEPVESTSPTSAFLVAVSADTAPTAGVVRTEKDFELLQSALQTANHDKAFKFGLPKLPPRPRSLFRAGGKSAEQERAAALQAHLAELVTHPEVVQIAAFQAFISAAAAAPAAAPEPGSPPVRAREGSGALGSGALTKLPAAIVRAASRYPGADKKASTSVKLTWTDAEGEEKSAELPILEPTEGMGNRVIDVRSLAAKTGFFTHDPGFTSTSSCESCITFIDGDKGVLLHRGYAISDLAANCTFPEVAFLLMEGELPDASHLDDFTKELGSHAMVHEKLIGFYQGFKSDAHPMAIMVRSSARNSARNSWRNSWRNSLTPPPRLSGRRRRRPLRLLPRLGQHPRRRPAPALRRPPRREDADDRGDRPQDGGGPARRLPEHAARLRRQLPPHDVRHAVRLGRVSSMEPHTRCSTSLTSRTSLHSRCAPYVVNPVHARALETIFILHADHEQNASTSTVRIASSSQANPFACMAAGIASLWGPAHGGANEAALRMLTEIGSVGAWASNRWDSPLYRPPTHHAPRSSLSSGRRDPRLSGAREGQGGPDAADGLRPPRVQELRPARQADGEGVQGGARVGGRHRLPRARDRAAAGAGAQFRRNPGAILAQFGAMILTPHPLAQIALEDEYFVKRKLYPNVDFYSGIVLRALGIPVNMFTVLFAVARSVGWLAQWNESFGDPSQRICRPRQLYHGTTPREFAPMEAR